MFDSIKNFFVDIAGTAVGYLEMIGFKYPVKDYMEEVSPTLWRGSRRSPEQIKELKEKGFKRVINLCMENDNDREPCAKYGLAMQRIPIYDNQVPTIPQVGLFLNIVVRPSEQPVFVHCEAGRGRTGLMVACYRIAIQGWMLDAAVAEAKEKGMAIEEQEEFIREQFYPQWKSGQIQI